MKRVLIALAIGLGGSLPLAAQETRIASDFELAHMEQQLARVRDFEAQLSGRLNLGDIRTARNERSLARAEYTKALQLANRERVAARRDSALARYANATSYAALAQAKLGRDGESFELLEESARYAADGAETWNLYASAMRILGHPRKAVSAARNAVALAQKGTDRLDLAIYRHALASALFDAREDAEAERLLVTVVESLRSSDFAPLRREVERQEAFHIYSSARGDVAAYVSLLNRSQLQLATIYERRGDLARARTQYEHVLEARDDDVTALAGAARVARNDAEREQLYRDAFQANPYSMPLVREYRKYLQTHAGATSTPMQTALLHLHRGEMRDARVQLDAMLEKYPDNETLRTLRREAEGSPPAIPAAAPTTDELRRLLAAFERLTPEQRAQLDQTTYTSVARFEGDVFERGTIEGVRFRFSEAAIFQGDFDVRTPLRLTYRILGITRDGDTAALLLEPVKLEVKR
jgi:tetratricopeptide (TPR) repeat protein